AKLEVGSVSETVEVTGGAEILQTETAALTSTLVGQQLHELPFTSRNLTELIVTQAGSATPGVPRSTSVYGLPQSALNVTLDGINIQDNSNRSSDGFFNAIFPRADAVEEMTVSGASAGADSNAEGAFQVKMVTRSGTNEFHGTLFEQHRNQDFNANFYFNNINSQPRDHIVFNQFGGLVGGPIKKNKLFFFAHMEAFRLPQTYTEPTGMVLTPGAVSGIFTEKHHIEFIYNYQTNIRRPDGVNVGTASPAFPGTGNVLNGTEAGNQGGIAFQAVAALRSTLTPHLTSELRFGLIGGTVIFNNG